MTRTLLCAITYLLVWYLLSAMPVAGAGSGWLAVLLIYTITGPLIILAPRTQGWRYLSHSVIFIRAILVLVLMYTCAVAPAPSVILLSLFAFESVMLLDRQWVVSFAYIAFIIVFTLILPGRVYGREITRPPFLFFLILSAYLVFAAFTIRKLLMREMELEQKKREIAKQKELIDQVYLLNTQFQEYALNAERKSAEEERKRITRDIHDIMGYTLVNLRVMLEVSLDLAGNANTKLTALLSDAIRHTREGLKAARMALRNLRVIEETNEFWMNRINRIMSTFSNVTGVTIRVSWGNVTRSNCPRLKNAVYQFVQESLTNSFKHGKATVIDIDFRIIGTTPDDRFIVRIIDNGRGSTEIVPGIGFAGNKERAEQLEGETGFRNLDNGFEVWIAIPMLSMRKDI